MVFNYHKHNLDSCLHKILKTLKSRLNNITEYFDYIEKYDYYNITKESIIEMAPDKSKSIFDWHLHTIVGSDKLGRPVVIFKIKNIDKEVFSDIDSSRLYMLYQVILNSNIFS